MTLTIRLLIALLGPLFASVCASATPLTPDFYSPFSDHQVRELLGDVRTQVVCPERRHYSLIDEMGRAALRRNIRIYTTADTTLYRDPRLLGALLLRARDFALDNCPISIRDSDGRFVRISDGGAVDIFAAGRHVVHVASYTHKSFGTAYDLAPEPLPLLAWSSSYVEPAGSHLDATEASETPVSDAMEPELEIDQPDPQHEEWPDSQTVYEPGAANTPQGEYAGPETVSSNGQRPGLRIVGVIAFILLVLWAARTVIDWLRSFLSGSPDAYRYPIEDMADRAVYDGAYLDMAAFKAAFHDRPTDPDDVAAWDERLYAAASRMRSNEAELSGEAEQYMREAAARAERQGRSSREYDLTPAEAELLRAALAQQIAAARLNAAKKGRHDD